MLLRLLIDASDTAVTDKTCDALLARNDLHGVRLIAQAVTHAPNPEYLDHIHGRLIIHLLPDGPMMHFIEMCTDLARNSEPSTATGARKLLQWTQPWPAAHLNH